MFITRCYGVSSHLPLQTPSPFTTVTYRRSHTGEGSAAEESGYRDNVSTVALGTRLCQVLKGHTPTSVVCEFSMEKVGR
jgi:hypothetical protein